VLTAALVALLIPLAQAPWVGSHCNNREHVNVVPRVRVGLNLGGSFAGAAVIADPNCEAWVAEDLTPRQACTVLTHEFGHLAGMQHSHNKRSVMYPRPATPRRCRPVPDH
jgi:cyanophycinase-like exopeptidase